MLRKGYSVVIVAIALLIIGASYSGRFSERDRVPDAAPSAEGAMIISNDLSDIYFCGEVYRSRRVLVDQVEVVSRIAVAASEKRNYFICENIKNNRTADIVLTLFTRDLRGQPGGLSFYLSFGPGLDFNVDPERNVIEHLSSFDRHATLLVPLK